MWRALTPAARATPLHLLALLGHELCELLKDRSELVNGLLDGLDFLVP